MIRLAHLSDIQIPAPMLEWTLRDWFNKRYAAWVNFRWLGRRRRFRDADVVLARLMAALQQRRPVHIGFSGDAPALALQAEFNRAPQMPHVGAPQVAPRSCLPG